MKCFRRKNKTGLQKKLLSTAHGAQSNGEKLEVEITEGNETSVEDLLSNKELQQQLAIGNQLQKAKAAPKEKQEEVNLYYRPWWLRILL